MIYKFFGYKEEEEHRIGIWIKNMAKIVAHNLEFDLKQKSYRMEMNHFGDLVNLIKISLC